MPAGSSKLSAWKWKFEASTVRVLSAAPVGSADFTSLSSAAPSVSDPPSSTRARTPHIVSTNVEVRSFGIAATTVAPMSTDSVAMIAAIVAGSFEFSDAARKIRDRLMVKSATVRIATTGMRNGNHIRSLRSSTRCSCSTVASSPGRSATATAVPPPPTSPSAAVGSRS